MTIPADEVTVKINIEVTEKGREIVKGVVIDVLKELFSDTPWLEERVNECVDQAFARKIAHLQVGVGGIA